MTAHAGQLIAARRFRLGAAIGETPLGVRWAARDAARVAEVEFFALHAWVTPGPAQRRAFDEAASAIARLRHDALAPVLAHGVNPAGGWLVTPLRYGRPLDDLVAARGRLAATAAAALLAPVADAIAAAHAQGILHGDLRPAQISVVDDAAMLSGLGLAPFALVYGARPDDLQLGERPFLAPERAAGRLPSAPGDAYALGALLQWLVVPGDRSQIAPLVSALRRRGMRSRPTLALAAEWLGALARDETLPALPVAAPRTRVMKPRSGNSTIEDTRNGDSARHETVAAETAATGLGGAAATPSVPMAGVGGRPAGSGMPSAPPAPELPEQPPRRVRREGPVAAPPAPAPAADASTPPRRRRARLRVAAVAALLGLGAGGTYMFWRAVHDDGGARAADTTATATAPAPTTSTPAVPPPATTAPAATTTTPTPTPAPAAALHPFPSHTCRFSVPAGYAPVWVDLDRGDVEHSEALSSDGARVSCDVPARPIAARAAARAARRGPLPPGYRQESFGSVPGGAVAWVYRARPGAPADPTEVRVETRFVRGGTAISVQAPVARSTDLAATFAAVLASFRPRRG